ncbi:MAG: metallophosphoesterase [Acidobacteriota bacterium]
MSLQASRREFLRVTAAALAASSAAFSQSATILRNIPYVQNVHRTQATICWTALNSSDATVEFWDDSREVRTTAAKVRAYTPAETGIAAAQYRFEAVLDGLQPGLVYTYRAYSGGELLTPLPQRFQTPGDSGFTFVAFGDSGTGSPAQASLAARMLTSGAQFVLHTGDLVYPAGTYERYQSLYFAYYQDLMRTAPFFPCPGNHDYWETSSLPYRALHSLPSETIPARDQGRYYSFDWGNAHFVSLDTNDTLADAAAGKGEMLRWLEADLAASRKFWRVVLMHHPPYASGVHDGEPEAELIRKYISPILDRFHVPLVLNGHEHSYQRSKPIRGGQASPGGTVYLTTGGGGAPLHPVRLTPLLETGVTDYHFVQCAVDGAKLQVDAVRPDGSTLDSWTLAPQPVVAEGGIVDAAGFGQEIACGGIISIFGEQLSPCEVHPTEFPLPCEAAGCAVTLNERPLPLLMASAMQINVQLPFDVTGLADLAIQTPNGTLIRKVTILPAAPAVFECAILHESGEPVSKDSPARSGEILSVYATGMGKPQGTQEIGEAAKPLPLEATVLVSWSGNLLAARSATLAAGLCGVSVITFEVPETVGDAAQLRILADGKASAAVAIPVV